MASEPTHAAYPPDAALREPDARGTAAFATSPIGTSPNDGPESQLDAQAAHPFESPDGLVWVLDGESRLRYASPGWEALFRHGANALGRPIQELLRDSTLAPGHRAALETGIERALAEGPCIAIPLCGRLPGNGFRQLEGRCYRQAGRSVLVFHPTLPRREARARPDVDEQLLRAEKLETLGVLAAGVAHDFSNLLTPILGNASLLLADLPAEAPERRWAEAIRRAADRATSLTSQMLAYAGRSHHTIELLDVSALIRNVGLLLETTASKRTRLTLELTEDLPLIHGDASQITQVVVNLVANGSEALGDSGGHLSIRTRSFEASRATLDACHLGATLRTGKYVLIEVLALPVHASDEIDSLPASVRESMRAGVPRADGGSFPDGRSAGRGPGLSVALGAIRAHEGALHLSEPADGRTGHCYRVLLPPARAD